MNRLSSSQQIKYGAILSYLGIVVYILIGLLYTPWMIKVIGKDDYGLFTLAYSVISFFIFDFGISAAVHRFVSKYLADEDEMKVNNCISVVYRLYLYIDIFILLILCVIYFFIPHIYTELSSLQVERLKIVFIIAGCFSVFSFPFIPLNGILSAYEKFVQLKVCDLTGKILTVGINILCLSLGGGLYSIVATNALVGLFVVIIKFILVSKYIPIKIELAYKNASMMKRLLSFSGWTTIVALSQRCIFNISPTLLAMFVGADVVAVFGISVSLEAYMFTLAFALNGLFLPKISRLLACNESVLPLMIRVGRIQIFIIGAVVIGFIVAGKDFINSWLGPGFEGAYMCTILLILPSFFFLPADIAEQTLIASDQVKYRAYVYCIMAFVNIVLSYFMLSVFGLIGLAFSIFIAYTFRSIALYFIYYKILRINIFNFIYNSYIRMSFGLLLSLLISVYISDYVLYAGWLGVGIKVVIVVVVYTFFTMVFSLNNEERIFFKNIIFRLCKIA